MTGSYMTGYSSEVCDLSLMVGTHVYYAVGIGCEYMSEVS